MRAGHARPPVVDLQLSDRLWHDFSTVFKGGKVWYASFWIASATSLSVKVVDGGEKGRNERGSKISGFCEMAAKEKSIGLDWSSLAPPSPPEVKFDPAVAQ